MTRSIFPVASPSRVRVQMICSVRCVCCVVLCRPVSSGICSAAKPSTPTSFWLLNGVRRSSMAVSNVLYNGRFTPDLLRVPTAAAAVAAAAAAAAAARAVLCTSSSPLLTRTYNKRVGNYAASFRAIFCVLSIFSQISPFFSHLEHFDAFRT